MKIIDFETKGNVIRFALGDDNCTDYWGDDWNDRPYEHNAGAVYDKYVKGYATIFVDFKYPVLTPESDWHYQYNSPFSKEDFKLRAIPCIVIDKGNDWDPCYSIAALDKNNLCFYFNQKMEPGQYLLADSYEILPFENS